uniref:Uncharacterized protein n=1 Tax=Stomoxys calcitrans TaxID=35570 RepID=A0A1I8P068_STOCA
MPLFLKTLPYICWAFCIVPLLAFRNVEDYHKLLQQIFEERPFDTILLLDRNSTASSCDLGQAILQYPVPKVVVTNREATFIYKQKFNAEILVTTIMMTTMDLEVMETMAHILEYMRQTRILTLAIDVQMEDSFKNQLLESCKSFNITNNVLHIINSNGKDKGKFFILKPYPRYHWHSSGEQQGTKNFLYYPQHWRNMHKKTLLTFADQSNTRVMYFKDPQGNLKMNGICGRLVMLFAEHYNASLQMAFPLSLTQPPHFTVILETMIKPNLLDIPMVPYTAIAGDYWINSSDVFEYDQGLIMVPCAQLRTLSEVYDAILTDEYFWGYLITGTTLLSFVHSLIDYVLDEIFPRSRIFFSERIFPGLLGQPFVARCTKRHSLKILYLLLFIAGLNFNCLFSAEVRSLFTSPGFYPEIRTLDDLSRSPYKLLLHEVEAKYIMPEIKLNEDSIATTQNLTYLYRLRQELNLTYSYYCSLLGWKSIERKQEIIGKKVFCTYENLTVIPSILWSMPLQHNSPYKEALNYLIHLVHDFGLAQAWFASTFSDLLKLQENNIKHTVREPQTKSLSVENMQWIWILMAGGLLNSGLVFLLELVWGGRNRCWYCSKLFERRKITKLFSQDKKT